MHNGKSRLRARPIAEITPDQTRAIAARIAPDLRAGIVDRVREALTFHDEIGETDAARFCLLLLDALRELTPDRPRVTH